MRFLYAPFHPDNPMVEQITWHEHSGDLLVQEMNVAGVDKSILIGYNSEDILWSIKNSQRWLAANAGEAETVSDLPIEDMWGGRKYAREAAMKHKDRFIWFETHNPDHSDEELKRLKLNVERGLKGVKLFPAYQNYAVDDPRIQALFNECAKHKLRVLISFEDLYAEVRYTRPQYVQQLEATFDRFSDVSFCLLHAGSGLPNMLDEEPVMKLTKRFDNLMLGTAIYFIDPEYPFQKYLSKIQLFRDNAGIDKLMWATDWPYTESFCKYHQMINAVRKYAAFLNEEEKRKFLGDNAARFLGLN